MKNIISQTTYFHPFILKKAQIFGAFAPKPHKGLCLWTLLGQGPQTPLYPRLRSG